MCDILALPLFQSYLGGLCCCRIEGGCVPWPKSPGYTDPDRDERGYRIVHIKAGEGYDQPVAITRSEIQRELRRHPERR